MSNKIKYDSKILIELIIGRLLKENEDIKLNQQQFDEKEFWEVLLNENIITLTNIRLIKDIQRFDKKSTSINEIIIEENLASERDIVSRLYKYHNDLYKSYVMKIILTENDINKIRNFDLNLKKSLSEEKGHIVFSVDENNKYLKIAVSSIMNITELNNTKVFYESRGYKVDFYATSTLQLNLCLKNIYEDRNYDREVLYKYVNGEKEFGDYVREYFSKVIEIRTLENASDIYLILDRESKNSKIFFKINREKQYRFLVPTENLQVLFTTVKNERNIENTRKGHHDGGMIVKILNNKYPVNLRINTITIVGGEQMTLRLQSGDIEKLDEIGLTDSDYNVITNKLKIMEGGIVCLTGVTGSGKSRTIRRCLNSFDFSEKNIITMEDPVEVVMKGVNQIQINNKRNQSFLESIRRCMRQSPDIIVIGEIRDAETRERRVERATTGHLVFTTIHRSNVRGIEDRLKELKVENIDAFMNVLKIGIYQKLKKEDNRLKLKYEIMFEDKVILDRGIKELEELEKNIKL